MNFIAKTALRLKTLLRYKELFFQLVSKDIKLKYRRSFLGYLWTILNPMMIMIVYFMVFSNIFSRGMGINNFAVYLLSGQLLFNFMIAASSSGMMSVVANAGLLKKIYVPKYIFTLSAVTSELVIFFFSFIAFLIVTIITKTPITIRYFLILIPIIQLYIFSIGMGLFLGQTYVFFRDIGYIWNIVTTAWMFLSCIFYTPDILPEKVGYIVTHYNPLYFYITMFRNFTIGTAGMGSLDLAIRGAIAAFIMLFIGLFTFTMNKKKFILYM